MSVQESGRRKFGMWERKYDAIHRTDIDDVAIDHWNWEASISRCPGYRATATLMVHNGLKV